MQEKRLMAHGGSAGRLRPAARSLVDSLRHFLTPALWKQAKQARGRRRRPRRAVQPLVLVLLALTWACGDSTPERFETARAFAGVCLPKRRRPGRTLRGFQKARARLPMPALRAVAAGVRRRVRAALAAGWYIDGFVPLGCDGARLECPRAEELEGRLGPAGKPGSAPTVWLTALVHLRLGVPWAWRRGKGTASERTHLRRLLPSLPPDALPVADAGYVGYDLARTLLERRAHFLIRLSSQATFHREGTGAPTRFRDGEAYYRPPAKKKGDDRRPPLRVRLIRVREKRHGRDVWLATDVADRGRLPAARAARFDRWRWESEGLFRTYKRTLAKVKLHSRTVRLVHREAEGSLLAAQLLLAQGARALLPRAAAEGAAAVGVGPVQVAADKPEGEFLRELVGRLRVAEGAQQVAVDGLAVAAEQLVAGGGRVGGLAVVGLADHRPVGLDAAEPRVAGLVVHDAPPGGGRPPPPDCNAARRRKECAVSRRPAPRPALPADVSARRGTSSRLPGRSPPATLRRNGWASGIVAYPAARRRP
jgi:Transposase DDE domain